MTEYLNSFREMIRGNNWVILDTETTGLNWPAEIVQIAVMDGLTGAVLVDSLVRPAKHIPPEATAVHGITDEMVADAPEWAVIRGYVENAFRGHEVVIYNAEYDLRLMAWTDRLHFGGKIPVDITNDPQFWCAMTWYAEYFGAWSESHQSYTWQRLTAAVEQLGIKEVGVSGVPVPVGDLAHNALGDCAMTRGVILEVVKRLAETDVRASAKPNPRFASTQEVEIGD